MFTACLHLLSSVYRDGACYRQGCPRRQISVRLLGSGPPPCPAGWSQLLLPSAPETAPPPPPCTPGPFPPAAPDCTHRAASEGATLAAIKSRYCLTRGVERRALSVVVITTTQTRNAVFGYCCLATMTMRGAVFWGWGLKGSRVPSSY